MLKSSTTMAGPTGAPEYKKLFKSDFGLEIIVTIGGIVDVGAEAAVTGEERTLQHEGFITKALMKSIPEFREKRNELRKKSIKEWSVHKTVLSGSSNFKFVFHVFFDRNNVNWVNNMIKLYEQVLKKAEKRRIEVLAIPLLGSGVASLRTEDCVQALVTAIAQYKRSSLKTVLLVSKEWEKADKLSTQCEYQFSPLTKEVRKSRKLFGIFSRQSSKKGNVDHTGSSSQTVVTGTQAADKPTQGRQVTPDPVQKRSTFTLAYRQIDSQRLQQSLKRHTTDGIPEDNRCTTIADTRRTRLTEESDEYKEVAKSFLRHFTTKPTIKMIEPIEASSFETQYTIKRNRINQSENPPSQTGTERILWHHTSKESSEFICTNGFNRSQCGKDGAAGCGVYFTVSPNSDVEDTCLDSQPANDLKYVFRVRVLTGTFTTGTPGQRVLPQRETGVLYDSTVDDVDKPRVYVIYNDTQAYPEYLITYTDHMCM